jgi:glycosyltransferase involved in cell wall biosynthesis
MNSVSVFSYGTPEHALGHLRICAPLKLNGIQVNWYRPTDDFSKINIIECDVVIIQRDFPRDLEKYLEIITQAQKYNIPIILELDDLLWDLPPDHPDRISNHYLDALWPMLIATLLADAVVVSTPVLQESLNPLTPAQVVCLPNYLDDSLWQFQEPKKSHDKSVRIGYMGGESHFADIQPIVPAIEKILYQYRSQIELVFWGGEPPEELLSSQNVEWHELNIQDYVQFAEYFAQQEFDIFLAPLSDNRFNRAKSPIKYLECATLGGVGVCSQIDPYLQVIEHGKTGFLANSLDSWFDSLSILIENPVLRSEILKNSHENIQRKWLLSNHSQEWMEVYQKVIDDYKSRDYVEVFRTATDIKHQWQLYFENENKLQDRKNQILEKQIREIKSARLWKVMSLCKKWRDRW